MISGIRKPPPISTSSPRDTTTPRSRARAASTSSTAAAPLFTTSAGLGAAGPGQEGRGTGGAGAPLAGGQVELQVGVGRVLVVGQRGPAEVGVQQHAGGVDHGLQEATPGGPDQVVGPVRHGGLVRAESARPDLVRDLPGHVHQQGVGERVAVAPGQGPGQGVDRRGAGDRVGGVH